MGDDTPLDLTPLTATEQLERRRARTRRSRNELLRSAGVAMLGAIVGAVIGLLLHGRASEEINRVVLHALVWGPLGTAMLVCGIGYTWAKGEIDSAARSQALGLRPQVDAEAAWFDPVFVIKALAWGGAVVITATFAAEAAEDSSDVGGPAWVGGFACLLAAWSLKRRSAQQKPREGR